MKKWRIFIIMALAAVIAVSTLVFPWTMTLWTSIEMPGIKGSAGFIGRTIIVWSTVAIVGTGVFAFSVAAYLLKRMK